MEFAFMAWDGVTCDRGYLFAGSNDNAEHLRIKTRRISSDKCIVCGHHQKHPQIAATQKISCLNGYKTNLKALQEIKLQNTFVLY